VCTPLLQGPQRKGGFCVPLRRYTLYTNNSRSNYQIRIHSLFSLCSPFVLSPFPYLPGEVTGFIVARRFARARMNGDLSLRWERAVRRTFFLAAGRRPKREMGRREREREREGGGEKDVLSTKINTYSCNFITDGYVGSIRVCSVAA